MTEQDFIELLALFSSKHPKILDDPSQRYRRFSQAGESIFTETTLLKNSLDVESFCVITSPELYTTSTEDIGQSYIDHISVNFEVAKSIDIGDDVAQKIAQEEAKEICEDIWRELLFYKRNRTPPLQSPRTSLSSVRKQRTSGGEHNLCGYRFEFTIKTPITGIPNNYTPFSI